MMSSENNSDDRISGAAVRAARALDAFESPEVLARWDEAGEALCALASALHEHMPQRDVLGQLHLRVIESWWKSAVAPDPD